MTAPPASSLTPASSSPRPLVFGVRPVAIREGQAVAQTLFGKQPVSVTHNNIPSAVFSQPPIGTVGDTEAQAIAKYGQVEVYQSTFRAMKRSVPARVR